jgi:hypothetical protein
MRQAITTLPGELFRTITWDQGKEMAVTALQVRKSPGNWRAPRKPEIGQCPDEHRHHQALPVARAARVTPNRGLRRADRGRTLTARQASQREEEGAFFLVSSLRATQDSG